MKEYEVKGQNIMNELRKYVVDDIERDNIMEQIIEYGTSRVVNAVIEVYNLPDYNKQCKCKNNNNCKNKESKENG